MSRTLLARLSALEALHEGQESSKPAIVAIRGIDGVIRADMPHPMESETFADAAALEARAEALGMRCILVSVIDGRRGASVQEKAQCAA